MNSTVRNIICVLISLAGILYLVIGIRQEKAAETAKIAEAREEQKQAASEITAEDSGRGWEADENTDSFYQKLIDGFDVKILVVGDTFADGPAASSVDKRWTSLLPKAIADEYDVRSRDHLQRSVRRGRDKCGPLRGAYPCAPRKVRRYQHDLCP